MKKLLILLCLACLFICCSDDSTTGITITGRWAMHTYVQRDDFMAFEMNPGQVTWTFTGNKLKVVNNFNYNNYRVWPPTGL